MAWREHEPGELRMGEGVSISSRTANVRGHRRNEKAWRMALYGGDNRGGTNGKTMAEKRWCSSGVANE